MREFSSPRQDVRPGGGRQTLPLGSGSSASGTPLQAAQGTHPEGRVIPMRTRATMAVLDSCLYFWPQEPATMPRMGWVTPCTHFSPQEWLPNHSSLPSLSFLALFFKDWEIPHLQQTPEDRAWQKNPVCNPVYLLLPACTEFNQTSWGFTHFQLQISS